jgi:hypothetical protein
LGVGFGVLGVEGWGLGVGGWGLGVGGWGLGVVGGVFFGGGVGVGVMGREVCMYVLCLWTFKCLTFLSYNDQPHDYNQSAFSIHHDMDKIIPLALRAQQVLSPLQLHQVSRNI